MSDKYYRDIVYKSLLSKTTEDLVQIWQDNHRFEWTDTVFEIIQEILEERLDEVPAQNEPLFQQVIEKPKKQESDKELSKFLSRSPKPILYKPEEVFWIIIWIKRLSLIWIVASVFVSIPDVLSLQTTVISYLYDFPMGQLISWVITIIFTMLAIVVQSLFIFFGLRAFTNILSILMEMDFRKRNLEESSENSDNFMSQQ